MKKLYTIILLAVIGVSANAQYTKLLDFNGTNGSQPYGSLISDGTFLYGMTQDGGTVGAGVLFKIKTDGSAYSKLLDFTGVANGGAPYGSLISDGTFLYGMTTYGGTCSSSPYKGCGTIFKIKPDGSAYSKLLDFTGVANGTTPCGSLISDGTFLYGMTNGGGTKDSGVVFKIKTDGSTYSKLLDFNGTNGSQPYGSLISDGTFLYGMTVYGGTKDSGVVFKIKTDGNAYSKLLDFNGTNGAFPSGSLISDGTFLYGMTVYGSTNNGGVIFKIKSDGTGHATLHSFGATATHGYYPSGSLISDGTFLYGMTTHGNTDDYGVIFKIKPDGTGYDDLFDFNYTNGCLPQGDIISDGTFLYGMTYKCGVNGDGTVFKINPTGMGIAENNAKIDFTIFPNPTNGVFQIKVTTGNSSKYDMEIYNVLGEKIYLAHINSDKAEIDLSKHPNGIYFLKVETSTGERIKKLIIQK